MKKVQIRAALSQGWSDFTRRPWYLLGLTLSTIVFFVMVTGDGIAAPALAYILYGGFLALFLKHAAGETVVFDDLFDFVDKRWIYFTFLGIVKTLLITLGLLLLVVPGVYLAVRWMFADLLVVEKGLRPLEALKASSALTEGVRWKLFFYNLVAILLVLLGTVVFGIGAVVAAIVCQFAVIAMYRQLEAPVAEVVPEEGEEHHG